MPCIQMLQLKHYLYKPEIKSKSIINESTITVSNDAYMTTDGRGLVLGGRGKQRAPATSVIKISKHILLRNKQKSYVAHISPIGLVV